MSRITAWAKTIIPMSNTSPGRKIPFASSLLKFHECITQGTEPITPVRAAVADIRFAGEIVRAAMNA